MMLSLMDAQFVLKDVYGIHACLKSILCCPEANKTQEVQEMPHTMIVAQAVFAEFAKLHMLSL